MPAPRPAGAHDPVVNTTAFLLPVSGATGAPARSLSHCNDPRDSRTKMDPHDPPRHRVLPRCLLLPHSEKQSGTAPKDSLLETQAARRERLHPEGRDFEQFPTPHLSIEPEGSPSIPDPRHPGPVWRPEPRGSGVRRRTIPGPRGGLARRDGTDARPILEFAPPPKPGLPCPFLNPLGDDRGTNAAVLADNNAVVPQNDGKAFWPKLRFPRPAI
jgi:hypothetical protein